MEESLKREIELLKQLVAAKDALITELKLKSTPHINIPSMCEIKITDLAPYFPRAQNAWSSDYGPYSTAGSLLGGTTLNPNKG